MNSFIHIYRYDTLDSTNTKAKELVSNGASHGTVVIADQQSAGRGRLGRRFFSPAGCGIYLSAIIRPDECGLAVGDITLLTTAASVAVARAISQVLNKEAKIKWVNDLYYNGKKVCGILTESVIHPKRGTIDAIIVGIGVNYREPDGGFPEELRDIAGALVGAHETAEGTRDALSEAIAAQMFDVLAEIPDRRFLDDYRSRSLLLGRQVRIFPQGAPGSHPDCAQPDGSELVKDAVVTVLGIADNGGLMVQYDDGRQETLTTGEISLRPLTGDRFA